jgi:hypothetical protein
MALIKTDDVTANMLVADGRAEAQAEHYHLCQNGDGNPATVVVVNLDDSAADILCTACNLAMWAAVLQQLAEGASTDTVDGQTGGA